MTQTPTEQATPATKEAWRNARDHLVTLPSKTQVTIRIPNLPNIIKAGNIPNALMAVATQVAATGSVKKLDAEVIKEIPDFYRYLVSTTVVKPELAPEDVDDLPYEDIELIVALATRETEFDAVGHQLAGLEKIDSFRRFRNLPDLDEDS